MDRYAAEKIRSFGTSVFAEMSRLAVQHQAVNLGQGFPDFAGPDFVKEAAKRAIDADLNQYAISHGAPRLRTAIAAEFGRAFDLRHRSGRAGHRHVSGATEVIFDAIQAFIGPGDELVAFEPFYDSYPTATRMAGGTFVPIRLAPAGLVVRSGRAAGGDHDRTRVLAAQHAAQPDRQGLHARRARVRSPSWRRSTTWWC